MIRADAPVREIAPLLPIRHPDPPLSSRHRKPSPRSQILGNARSELTQHSVAATIVRWTTTLWRRPASYVPVSTCWEGSTWRTIARLVLAGTLRRPREVASPVTASPGVSPSLPGSVRRPPERPRPPAGTTPRAARDGEFRDATTPPTEYCGSSSFLR